MEKISYSPYKYREGEDCRRRGSTWGRSLEEEGKVGVTGAPEDILIVISVSVSHLVNK